MSSETDEIIPIDQQLEQFSNHLATHPRTIFSAGYGEGKTYFLNSYINGSEDEFIVLYPVNYQVADNKDIFELIKHDILFQLFIKGILTPDTEIAESVSLSYYLYERANPDWLLDNISHLNYPGNNTARLIGSAFKFFSKIKDGYDNYKARFENDQIKFWDKIANESIYESDPITALIRNAISDWKHRNPSRRIILIVEDLDRIDPAHLFRILNILSAHIDYCNQYGVEANPDSSAENKFGFDNIVCVFDYHNAAHIFHHFYGPETCWEGYINKFSTRGRFDYSLSRLKVKYFHEQAARACRIDITDLQYLLPATLIEHMTIRKLKHSLIDIEQQVKPLRPVNINNIQATPPRQLPLLAAIMRRLGFTDEEITHQLQRTLPHNQLHASLLLPYYLLQNGAVDKPSITLGEKENGVRIDYEFKVTPDSEITTMRMRMAGYVARHADTTLPTLLSTLLTYVIR